MRAKLDENMPVDAKPLLAAAGWSVATVHDEGLVGAPEKHNGIVVLRPVEPDRESVLALLTAALPLLAAEPVRHRLWIVEPDRIRIRGGSQSSTP